MKVIGVIPSRLNANRFPGKPMANIHGMPMVEHCYHRTRLTPGISSTYVATCDDEIAKHIHKIGGNAILTADSHTSAITRTAEAMQIIEEEFREKIDNGKFAELNVHPSGDYFFKLPEDLRNKIPTYIKENINLERFINA